MSTVSTMPAPVIQLVPLTSEWLPRIQPWFDHAEVQRWLGGPDWIATALRLRDAFVAGEEFRGAIVLGAFGFVAVDTTGVPVGYIGGEVYDRETYYVGGGPDHPRFEDTSPDRQPFMGIALVVDPVRWRAGWGLASIRALLANPDLAYAQVVKAGIEPENTASRRLFSRAGFRPEFSEPDWEGMLTYRWQRMP